MHSQTGDDRTLIDFADNNLVDVYVSPPFSPAGQWKVFGCDSSSRRDSVMDYNDPSRRRDQPHVYADVQSHRQQQQQQPPPSQQSQHGSESTTEQYSRFRQATTLHGTPMPMSSTARAGGDAQVYGFSQSTPYNTATADPQAMHYPTDMQTTDHSRMQDHSQYSAYTASPLYGTESMPPPPPPSAYDHMRFRSTMPTENMSQQMAIAQTSHFFLPDPAEHSSTAGSDFKYPQLSSQYQLHTAYGQGGSSGTQTGSLLDSTPSGIFVPDPPSEQQNLPPPTAYVNATQEISGHFEAYARHVFSQVHSKNIQRVDQTLLDMSYWLLGHVETLGLTRDEEDAYHRRLQMWTLFNHAWLAALQAQFDLTQEMLSTQQHRFTLSHASLERLGDELVRLCNGIEQFGMVDYQMGVAEDEILELLLKCIALIAPQDLESPENMDYRSFPESSASAAARGQ